MTNIKINNKYIEVEGHSGYAPEGSDIVCAAISTLTQATYNYLEATSNDIDIETSEGYLRIIFKSELNGPGESILSSFIEMVKDLESQYGKYIKLEGDII